MLFGLVTYVVYRKLVEGTSLTERVTVPEVSLKKQAAEIEYSSILVPVFGTEMDDEIIATAGRLADAEVEEGESTRRMDVIFVAELPLTVPIDAPLPKEIRERADRALARADQVGDEYENVEVGTAFVRARSAGAGIVAEARQRGSEVIVMGAEPPTRIRGGAILGGIGAARPAEIGEVTEYVLKKAPCRVLLTAPPEDRVVVSGAMFVLIVGCGRVGSSVARSMLRAGNEVSCLDEDPEAHARLEVGLESSWEDAGGQFTVGTGLETDALVAAGIEKADAFVASTDGDNTNIVIAQIAQRRYNVPNVVARILDPLRAEWYEKQGMKTVCPTRVAINMLEDELTGAMDG